MHRTHHHDHDAGLTVHVDDVEDLLDRADVSRERVELVLAPVELHRRNLKRRLREAQRARDAFELTDPVAVAASVLDAAGRPTGRLDRIDRLSALRAALEDDALDVESGNVTARHLDDPERLEQYRSEVEAVTNFAPERLDALRGTAAGLDAPIDADASEGIELALAAQRALRARAADGTAASDAAVVRRATRVLRDDERVWTDAYPGVERCSLAGLSSLPAPQVDLLAALARATDVGVHVYLRRATGAYLRERLDDLLAVDRPGTVAIS